MTRREHDDDCATLCPIPPGEKCRIGHGCWCSALPPRDRRGRFVSESDARVRFMSEEPDR